MSIPTPFGREVGVELTAGKSPREAAMLINEVFRQARESPCAVLLFTDLDILLQQTQQGSSQASFPESSEDTFSQSNSLMGGSQKVRYAQKYDMTNPVVSAFSANLRSTQEGSAGVVVLATICTDASALPKNFFDVIGSMPQLNWPTEVESILQCHGIGVLQSSHDSHSTAIEYWHNRNQSHMKDHTGRQYRVPSIRQLIQAARYCSYYYGGTYENHQITSYDKDESVKKGQTACTLKSLQDYLHISLNTE